MTTRNDFVRAARDAGIRSEASPTSNYVYVWADPSYRDPADTVWFQGEWLVWGGAYEHTAPGRMGAAELVASARETLT